jgi:DNA-binding NarL/FixJ family response regulator
LNRIGVLLLDMTGIAGDLVRQIVAEQDDIEMVDATASSADLDRISLGQVDLVITMYRDDRFGSVHLDRLLAAKPGLRALAVQDQGRTAVMYQLVPQTTQLGPLSPDTLVELIRTLSHGDRQESAR